MQPIYTLTPNLTTMKKVLIYIFAITMALLSFYIAANAQPPQQPAGVIEKIGDMYITFNDSTKRNEFFQVFNQQGCPENIYIHDTMWQWCDGSLRGNRPPNVCPYPIVHDTIYLPATGGTTPPPVITSLFTTQTLPTVTVNDNTGVTLGVRLTTSKAGLIRGVRFYKVAGTTGTHTGLMYSTTGTLLQQIVFSGESASGWQYATFVTPQAVTAGQSFIIAYWSSTGVYPNTLNGFATSITNTPLTAPASTTAAPNGLYHYGTAPAFTDATYNKTNYWVDALYSPN